MKGIQQVREEDVIWFRHTRWSEKHPVENKVQNRMIGLFTVLGKSGSTRRYNFFLIYETFGYSYLRRISLNSRKVVIEYGNHK